MSFHLVQAKNIADLDVEKNTCFSLFLTLEISSFRKSAAVLKLNFDPFSVFFLSFISLSQVFSSVQLLSHVRACHPMDCSMPGFPVYHQLLELAQTHIHRVSDTIQPSHPPSSPSPPVFHLSRHQDLF